MAVTGAGRGFLALLAALLALLVVGVVHDRTTGRTPQPDPADPTYLVVDVVDGDTVRLGNGETVRLVGIDTPEVGECGYERAKDALTRLALHRRAGLGPSDEDRDRYGRLLRYLDVRRDGDTVDAGLWLLRQGLTVARYDSRDGYGRHPREPGYLAADRRAADPECGDERG
jgi:endonuclease YncB( thermonuclease family)